MTTTYLICGGTKFSDADLMERALAVIILHPEDAKVVHGDAPGADTLADTWADKHGVPCTPVPAEWGKFGRAAGPIRNRRMLDEHEIDVVVAFEGEDGTKNMVKQARARGIVVVEVTG